MNKTSLSKLAVSLLDFGSSLKISRDQWIQREELKKITYSCPNLARESVIGLTLEQIISLANIYGEALSCRFRLGDLTVLDITSTVNEENLNNFRNQTLGSPTLDFTLRLDKEFLIQQLKENDFEGYNIFLYFFPESLEKFLKLELDQLEKQLWGDEVAHKIILLVPDHEIKLQGSYMSVLGGKYAENWQEYLSQEVFNSEQLKSMYQNCQRFLRWQEVQISHQYFGQN